MMLALITYSKRAPFYNAFSTVQVYQGITTLRLYHAHNKVFFLSKISG